MKFEINTQNIITAIITAFVIWLIRTINNKFYITRPKLYISTGKVLTSRRTDYISYYFSYFCPIVIKNNSKFNAIDVQFIKLKNYNMSDQNIDKLLGVNNHIENYQSLDIETSLQKIVPFEELRYINYEPDGTRVLTFNLKISDPEEHYKPESLRSLKILIKYKSESNKTFYTLYGKKGGKESNSFFMFNPSFFINLFSK